MAEYLDKGIIKRAFLLPVLSFHSDDIFFSLCSASLMTQVDILKQWAVHVIVFEFG